MSLRHSSYQDRELFQAVNQVSTPEFIFLIFTDDGRGPSQRVAASAGHVQCDQCRETNIGDRSYEDTLDVWDFAAFY